MDISERTARSIVTVAWVAAAVGTVAGQLHALARARAHPHDFEESPLFRAWGEPATRALRPLLDWSDPWTVYVAYGKLWLPVCLAFTAAAYVAFMARRPAGVERRLWHASLAGCVLVTLGVVGDYFTPWMDQSFVLTVVALLVIGISGVPFGVVLLRRGFRPRVTAVLVIAFIPILVVVANVTSLGSALLPLMWGWAYAAHVAVVPGERRPVTAAVTGHISRRRPR